MTSATLDDRACDEGGCKWVVETSDAVAATTGPERLLLRVWCGNDAPLFARKRCDTEDALYVVDVDDVE
jgi:hypothetical protein